MACTRRDVAPRDAEVVAVEAGVDAASVDANAGASFQLYRGSREICALGAVRAACITRRDGDEDGFALRNGPPGTLEVQRTCHRSSENVVRCQGVEVARDVVDISAAPYLLRKDGTVVAVDLDDGPKHSAIYEARHAIARALGVVKKLVYQPQAACALGERGEVRCWTEPWTFSAGDEVRPARLRRVPKLQNVTDLFLYSWLELCALDAAGVVHCSAPPPERAEVCERRVYGSRCGVQTWAPSSGGPIVAGAGFDPEELLARPLVAVLKGARAIQPFVRAADDWSGERDAFEAVQLSERIAAGCAEVDGEIRCWRRAECERTPAIATVTELPAGAQLLALGTERGYARSLDGALYTFRRIELARDGRGRCGVTVTDAGVPQLRAERLPLAGPVRGVAAGAMTAVQPGAEGSCATLEDGSVWCWLANPGEPLGAPQRVLP